MDKQENLIEFMNKILDEKDIIKKKDKYLINYNSLLNIYPFNYLQEYCEENKSKKKNFIKCNKLVYFLDDYIHRKDTIGGNKKTNTVGKVAIIFDLVLALNKSEYISKDEFINNYKYNVIYDYTIKSHPFNRLAFRISHLIKQNIKKYYNNYLDVEFELNFDDGTGKKYDVVIKDKNKHLMIIEIQEDNSNHNNSSNDQYKQFIVNSKGLIIKYFEENKITNNYECKFFADLLHTCHEILIATSKEYRNTNLLLEMKLLSDGEINNLQEQLNKLVNTSQEYQIIESEIEKWKELARNETESNEQIQILYNYKIEALNNPNKDIISNYNIPLDVIIENLNLNINIDKIGKIDKKKSEDKIQIENLIIQFSIKYNKNYYFSYNSITKFLVSLNVETIFDLKMHFIHILTCTQEIYENYIKIIEDYKDSQINKFSIDNSKIKVDIENKCTIKFTRKIERRDNKIKDLKNEIEKLKDTLFKLQLENIDSDLENQEQESEIDI